MRWQAHRKRALAEALAQNGGDAAAAFAAATAGRRCTGCGQPAGSPCLERGGAASKEPHSARLRAYVAVAVAVEKKGTP